MPTQQMYSRFVELSLGLHVQEGLCNNKMHAINTALIMRVMDSREPYPTAQNSSGFRGGGYITLLFVTSRNTNTQCFDTKMHQNILILALSVIFTPYKI